MTAVESLKQTDQYQPAHRVNAFDVSDVSGWEALISGLKKVSHAHEKKKKDNSLHPVHYIIGQRAYDFVFHLYFY